MITFQEFKAEVNQVYQQDVEFTDLTSEPSSYAYMAVRVFDKVVYTKDGMWQYLCTGSSNYNTSLLAPSLLKAVDKATRESEANWQDYLDKGETIHGTDTIIRYLVLQLKRHSDTTIPPTQAQ